jgi:glycosyltransferase involved in cell wall biosynthesis
MTGYALRLNKDDLSSLRVLVIIPAYNEEAAISAVLQKLKTYVPAFDRLVVDDGSRDRTSLVVQALGERHIRLPVNLGYGLALQTGMKYALQNGYDLVACLDADGQHRPEDLPALVQALHEHQADIVIGSRYSDGQPYTGPFERRIGQLFFSYLTRLLIGQRIYDTSSGYKVMRVETCKNIVRMTFLDFHIETIVRLKLHGFKIIERPVVMEERTSGVSMHSFSSILIYPIKTLLLTLVTVFDVMLTRRSQ